MFTELSRDRNAGGLQGGIKRFAGGGGQFPDSIQNLLHRDETTGTFVSAGQHAGFFRAEEAASIGLKLRDVALGGGVFPHLSIHGWCEEDPGLGGEIRQVGGWDNRVR